MKDEKFNIITYTRKHSFKEAWEKTKYRYAMSDTPEQIARKEVIGYIGSITGLLFAMIFLILRGSWYFSIALVFGIYLMSLQLKLKLKYLYALKDIEKKFGGENV